MSAGPYTIFRVAKQASAKQAIAASNHNYRKYSVTNADEQAPHPSPELLNTAERNYWELATERLAEAAITPRRKDAILCVEVMMSASPEWFERDAQGRAADYSNHPWTQDNLTYLQKTFGKQNVLAFKLHQDEKSPHVHALIVPITEDGRLSGRDVVGRPALRRLQTSYAAAMAKYGLQRGVEQSQAKHKPMQQFYGQQAQTAQQAGKLVGAVEFVPATVLKPGRLDNLQQWAERQTKQVNEHFRPLLTAANQRAEVAASLALENAAAKDQVRVLQKQLHTSESHKQSASKQVGALTREVAALQQELAVTKQAVEQARRDRERFAVATYENRPIPELIKQGQSMQYARAIEQLKGLQPAVKAALDQQKFDTVKDFFGQVTGYTYDTASDGQPGRLRQLAHPYMSFTLVEARPEGEPPLLQSVNQVIEERTRRREQAEQRQAQTDRDRIAREQQALTAKELALMQQAFEIYRWKPEGRLQVCLLVPDQHVKGITELLCTPGSRCYGQPLGVQGQPFRRDGLTPVYTLYDAQKDPAEFITNIMAKVRSQGGRVYESTDQQTGREQALRQVALPSRGRQQGLFSREQDTGISY